MSQPVIGPFRREYHFLSNFCTYQFRFLGKLWATAEHAFQAAKTLDPAWKQAIHQAPHPGVARHLGRRAPLREDWPDVRLDVMDVILRAKFSDPGLARRLVATGDAELVEINSWNDTFWGVCRGNGHNHLGKILMTIRTELTASTARTP